ncbi:vitamin-D-receptor interacting mediator subunit 4-domain-containing protein [Aspergillus pseudotamarii]|uniref:Mediator of RNA polymerase II transcription subunit 4 n=1 Tax=Aspergillus pseudotamarii TaxID=132259 RepID=A0A5N6SDI4_ASPPS|nr:vitamin-D-receptor interacting mediator subunit 4-domain-containing protein [Aspergillus pseudotamarii]KAE8132722.1 vitamin-D-receptor interacting mediator subunit 4-domain-containing protein [Aspergillus pseudotamarii]
MNAEFQTSLSNLENKLNALITSLTTSPTAAGAPAAAVSLLDADDSLTSAIATLRKHQDNYARILRLRTEAASLEEKVKDIVKTVVNYEQEIRTVCNSDEIDSDSDLDDSDSSGYDSDAEMQDASDKPRKLRRTREVDYRLLLDFARRISKYNHQAAADAEAGAVARVQQGDRDTEMTGTATGMNGMEDGEAAPVSSVTKDATSWLDESANMTRQVYMLPYPMEDRIRLGLMGQIQLAGGEGRPGFDPDQEVERLIREAEGLGAADAPPAVNVGGEESRASEAAKAAAKAGSAAAGSGGSGGGMSAAAPKPKPKATLDLDLDDDDDEDDF